MIPIVLALWLAAAPGPPPAGAGVSLAVPFLPQTEILCGGAAAAMVYRFWGDLHADVAQFAPLVDRAAGGIAEGALISAARDRGWTVTAGRGSLGELEGRLREGRPQILLIEDRPGRYHYVVAIGFDDQSVIVHDPTWGPSRRWRRDDLIARWKVSDFWTASIDPPSTGIPKSSAPSSPILPISTPDQTRCDDLLDAALDRIEVRGLGSADAELTAVQGECPGAAGPLRELAGLSFSEKRWADAQALAERAAAINPGDPYTWNVLASSRFMQDDTSGALRAWNAVAEPRVDRVQIDGLQRARYSYIAGLLGIAPNQTLTVADYELAARRLEQLPDRVGSRVAITPAPDGYAVLNATLVERSRAPQGPVEWSAVAIQAAVNREVNAVVPGTRGEGEVWRASWRWWEHRPRVAAGFSAPLAGRLSGIWHVDFDWEAQTYATDQTADLLTTRETRTRGLAGVGNWIRPNLRYDVTAGLESWDGLGRTATLGLTLEQRAFRDRLALRGDITGGAGLSDGPQYTSAIVRVLARSSTRTSGWVTLAGLGFSAASAAAPLAIWPGAGEGQARPDLVRAHRLLDDGIIDGPMFGRRLATGQAEAQRWLATPVLIPVAVAAFVDAGSAWERLPLTDGDGTQVDAGAGVRIRLPGREGTLRVDYAHGLRDGRNAVTVGWSVW